MILVGDSIGNVIHGYGNTIPVTLEEILSALKAVKRGASRALLIADMPYGTYHVSANETVRNALQLMKEGGAEAVKLEGGKNRVDLVKRLVDEEIPVCGHIGLTPQSVHKLGGYSVQGKTQFSGGKFDRRSKTFTRRGRVCRRSRTRPEGNCGDCYKGNRDFDNRHRRGARNVIFRFSFFTIWSDLVSADFPVLSDNTLICVP